MYAHYSNVRGSTAIPKGSLHTIDASGSNQVCNTFGVHPSLPFTKTLYDRGDLLWVSNMGVLQQPTTKDFWWSQNSNTELFAHNFQYREVHKMDIEERDLGRGVGGR